jgi:hypothetical protein
MPTAYIIGIGDSREFWLKPVRFTARKFGKFNSYKDKPITVLPD